MMFRAPKQDEMPAFEGGRIVFARSTDDGRTFLDSNVGFQQTPLPGQFKEVQAPSRGGQNLEMTYDNTQGPGRGTLWCIYADFGAGDADIFVRSSKDHGKTWSDPVRVDDDATKHHQWMPNLAVAGDGSLHAFFLDKRYDPENKLNGVTHAWSLDQGKTWRNERVTNQSWDGDKGRHQDGYPWIGDYLGVDAVGDEVWVAVPDASLDGPPGLAAAHVHRYP
jgi:hypothetical protein